MLQVENVFLECILPLLIIVGLIIIVAIWPSEKVPGGF